MSKTLDFSALTPSEAERQTLFHAAIGAAKRIKAGESADAVCSSLVGQVPTLKPRGRGADSEITPAEAIGRSLLAGCKFAAKAPETYPPAAVENVMRTLANVPTGYTVSQSGPVRTDATADAAATANMLADFA